MKTVSEMLTELNTGDVDLRAAIIEKGVAVPDSTLWTDMGNKVRAITQDGGTAASSFGADWGRNPERPDLPFDADTGPDEGTIYFLFGASPTAINDFAIQFTGGMGFIHWPDGYTEGFSTAMKERAFDYSSLSETPDSDGIKWIWIKIVFTAGYEPTAIVHNVRPSDRPTGSVYYVPQIYEVYMNTPSLTTWSWSTSAYTRWGLMEHFRWYGKCNLSTLSAFGAYTLRLSRQTRC